MGNLYLTKIELQVIKFLLEENMAKYRKQPGSAWFDRLYSKIKAKEATAVDIR